MSSMKRFNLNTILIAIAVIAALVGIYFIFWWNREISITGGRTDQPKELAMSKITGAGCQYAERRPFAVMMASDPIARPLSGIGQADLVVEMPVTPSPNEVTRVMAVFQCLEPKEIGSVRSARGPFIPIAAGLKAIYAHWGGEHDSLDLLNHGIIDNIDALTYEGTTFFRKSGIKPPHNGFTSLALLMDRARALKYSLANSFGGFPHRDLANKRNVSNIVETIAIPYAAPYDVQWRYDAGQKVYRRTRGGTPEMDKNTNQQVTASVIVVLTTTAEPLRDQYLTVHTTGQGHATIYQEGTSIDAMWKKDPAPTDSHLMIVDAQGKEISFVPGTIWIEYILQ